MAKTPPSKSTKKATSKSPRSPIAAKVSGPVTLAEARTLAQARESKPNERKTTVIAALPAVLGAVRRKLNLERRREIQRRIRDYTAVMTIMKERGVRKPTRKAQQRAKAASFVPLQVMAEGDSWFDYPGFPISGGIIPRLEKRLGVPILNLAQAGDEVRFMLGVEQRKLLAEHLRGGCPARGPWDVLLFSGGGNDIVDNPMALWIKEWNKNIPPSEHIDQARFSSVLSVVRAAYEDLIELRNKLSPDTFLVFHAYDFAIPDGRGICSDGPWLRPTFELRNFPANTNDAFWVVQAMLKQFAAMLTQLTNYPKVTFIRSQATLEPQPSWWHNELHPSRDGFNKFADMFHSELKAQFPGRVLP